MKNLQNRYGLILYKVDKREEFRELLDKTINKSRMLKRELALGHCRDKQGFCIFQIRANAFVSYNEFDNFLMILSGEISKRELGIVIGHNDKEGHFWMDYPSEPVIPFDKIPDIK